MTTRTTTPSPHADEVNNKHGVFLATEPSTEEECATTFAMKENNQKRDASDRINDNEDEEAVNNEDGETEASSGDASTSTAPTTTTKKKKRKKKNIKKKKKSPAGNDVGVGGTDSSSIHQTIVEKKEPYKRPTFHGLLPIAFLDESVKYGQTDPPIIPVKDLFQSMSFPVGEIQPYSTNPRFENQSSFRESNAEIRARDILHEDLYTKHRWGAEVHRQVRNFAQSIIQPGIELADMCRQLENKNRELVQEAGLERGIAFPTGCSLNHVAAHYTPNPGDKTVLKYDDVMKVDFGVQIEGHIIDSAWTMSFNPRYDPLLESVREATNAGIRASGIDVRLCDVGAEIQEVMESYEVELDGTMYPIKAIRNLNGHSIAPYHIHAGKHVPSIKGGCDESIKMEEGEVYAIETFGSTGRGYVIDDIMECSHYMKRFDCPHIPLRMQSSKRLLSHINKTFGTLAFCRRWLEREDGGSFTVNGNTGKQEKYMGALKNLCSVGIIDPCPPLLDTRGSFTAQYEHTIIMRPTCKEVVSRGNDY